MKRNTIIFVDRALLPGQEDPPVDILKGAGWTTEVWGVPSARARALVVQGWRTFEGVKKLVTVATYPPGEWIGVQFGSAWD